MWNRFILYSPIEGIDLGKRLVALALGVFLIMVIQFIIHGKSKDGEIGDKLIEFRRVSEESLTYGVREAYAIRIGIVLLAGYVDTYTMNYRDKMICVTISVVASVSLISGTLATAVSRVACVIIGIVFALIMDELVLKKKLVEA